MAGIHGRRDSLKKETGHKMPGMGERAYTYAKACGIIGKSFIGKGMARLDGVRNLSELDRLVFPSSSRDLPEYELLPDLEDRITDRAVDSIMTIMDCFPNPPRFFVLLIRAYEYADLLSALMASLEGERNAPGHTDIGHYQTVRFDKWPDIRAMIEETEFEFLLDKKGVLYRELGGISLQTVLDRHYYDSLWASLFSLSAGDRSAAEKILADEISIKNSTWALRLRTYYWMSADEVKLHLVYIPVKGRKPQRLKSVPATLADDALRCLEYPLDSYESWSSWRWKALLNPDIGMEGSWLADPRYFQNSAARYLFNMAKQHFRLNPFSMNTVYCFIKMKQFEEDVLTSGAEGLSMGMSGKDVAALLGVTP